jgi:cell division protein FtsA
MSRRPELLVGLDIGTAKVAAMVGEPADGGGLNVVGFGAAPCEGLRKGVVVNMEATVQAMTSAIKEAELSAGCEIHSVIASVGGAHIKAFNSHGVVPVKGQEVSKSDVDRVLDAARAVALPLDRDVLHVLPQEFIVDGQDGIRDPIGMSGVRLEVWVHVVSTAITSAQNVMKCCQRAGVHVVDVVLAPLAAAEAVLTAEEKELGVAVVDVGAGTTGMVAYDKSAVRHTAVIAVGGNHVSSDVAAGLRTPFRDAERLKQKLGCASAAAVGPEETVEVPTVGGRAPRELSRRVLAEIIEPRMEEICALVRQQLARCGLDGKLASGVVLTGGGVLMDGVLPLAERVFEAPVRLGAPVACEGLDDSTPGVMLAGAVGLLRHAVEPRHHAAGLIDDAHLFGKMRRRMVGWLKEFM